MQKNLERWQPAMSHEFPLRTDQIKHFEELMQISLADPEFAMHSPAFLIASLVTSSARLSLVPTEKTRWRYSQETCQGEATIVKTASHELYTVCLEANQADAVSQYVKAFGLEADENQNYGTALRLLNPVSIGF